MGTVQIGYVAAETDTDDTRERLHRRLRTYLEESGTVTVSPAPSIEPVSGSRGAGDVALYIVNLVGPAIVSGAVGALTAAIIEFCRRSDRKVVVRQGDRELEVDHATAAEAAEFLKGFFVDGDKSDEDEQ